MAELQAEFAAIIGKAAMQRLSATLRDLYQGLGLEQDIFENSGSVDIRLLAQQLQHQLGQQGSEALARLLMQPLAMKR